MSPSERDTAWVSREFDRRADTYDDSSMHRWQAEQTVNLVRPRPDQQILDVATGTGLVARACAATTHGPHQIVGVDVSLGMLRTAASRSDSSFIQADAATLPFRPAVFDVVICVAAIPYLPDFAAAITEWRRVARPNALLAFTTPAADGLPTLRLIRQSAASHGMDLPDPHAGLGTVARIAQTAHDLGLRVEQIEQHGFHDGLGEDARAAYQHVLDYGFAARLRAAPPALNDAIFSTYQQNYATARNSGADQQSVMITTCRFLS